jgi:DNA-binding transcriptional regulator LsrR (DeoR family)
MTVALVGIGSLEPSPLLRQSGNAIPADAQDALRAVDAVGDICLRYFDASGDLVDSEFNRRVVGIDPTALRAVGRRVGVGGGSRKHAAVLAAVRGGWVNVLITDLGTATVLDGEAE